MRRGRYNLVKLRVEVGISLICSYLLEVGLVCTMLQATRRHHMPHGQQ